MKKWFMLAAVLCTSLVAVAEQPVVKPGVVGLDVEGNLVRNTVWWKYGKGVAPVFKDGTATFTSANAKEAQGLAVAVNLNQTEAKPIVLSAESKAENVSAPAGGNYSFYLDITYDDGSRKFAVIAPFKVGTHDWEKAETKFTPDKPIKLIRAHLLFRYKTGTASFRNAFLAEAK